MQEYQKQVIEENYELGKNISTLMNFLSDLEKITQLDVLDVKLLQMQLSSMYTYKDILETRILRFKKDIV